MQGAADNAQSAYLGISSALRSINKTGFMTYIKKNGLRLQDLV